MSKTITKKDVDWNIHPNTNNGIKHKYKLNDKYQLEELEGNYFEPQLIETNEKLKGILFRRVLQHQLWEIIWVRNNGTLDVGVIPNDESRIVDMIERVSN